MSDLNKSFNVPVVLFFFKRYEKTLLILDRLREVRPSKIYLISDGPRNDLEIDEIAVCRSEIERSINWECEIIKNYAHENMGVFNRIGLGAQWVFTQEEIAIFLEDDNLPELTFFSFCQEMLERYKEEEKILWICGTNYLVDSSKDIKTSYFFTQQMQPCGWASWASKFNKYYDGYLTHWTEKERENLKSRYIDGALQHQDYQNWDREKRRLNNKLKPNSWDYQMSFTLRYYDLFGIVPKYNQIKNIGVDEHSIHGGTSLDNNIMLRRFCYLETKSIEFPLSHPQNLVLLNKMEVKLGNIIKFPVKYRIKGFLNQLIKKILGIEIDTPLRLGVKDKWKI
jgi:hypothetical protein